MRVFRGWQRPVFVIPCENNSLRISIVLGTLDVLRTTLNWASAGENVTSPQPLDSQRLEAYFKVLAYANRIDLLRMLREPHTIDEIRLEPGAAKAGSRPARPISRQAVGYHLAQLVKAGLVRTGMVEREGRKRMTEFYVEQSSLYALVEDFRRLSTLGSQTVRKAVETVAMGNERSEPWSEGPKVVLVHGVYEGRAYPLARTKLTGGRGWIIGRRETNHVCLGYDPFVSNENSEILPGRDGFRLLDLRTARNGTYLNWQRVAPGTETSLKNGDVIGVGRSLLLFRDA